MAVLPSFPPLLGYVPREHLASGGQSSVYRALNADSDHLAAIKVVPLRLPAGGGAEGGTASMDPQVAAKAKQLVREMRIHETLQHRNILRLFGGETREECAVKAYSGGEQHWPAGLYMVLDLGAFQACLAENEAVLPSLDLLLITVSLQRMVATSSTKSVGCSQPLDRRALV